MLHPLQHPHRPRPSRTRYFHTIYDAVGKLIGEYSTIVENSADAKVAYLTNDQLGSPRITTDAIGQTTSRRDFMPYGEEISRSGYGSDTSRQKFTNYERDVETKLDYAKARMLGSSLGRFTSPDSTLLSVNAHNSQSWNRYVYVVNNPLLYTDPLGLWYLKEEITYKMKDGKEVLDKNGKRIIEKVTMRAYKSDVNDTAATLANQLGLGKDGAKAVQKQLDKVKGDGVRVADIGQGNLSRVFNYVEDRLESQRQREERGESNKNTTDCSETAMEIGFGEDFPDIGTPNADGLLGLSQENGLPGYSSTPVETSALQVGDVARWSTGPTPQHFANFIFRNVNGDPVVFSKSGQRGPYEIQTSNNITRKYPNYGSISGFHRPSKSLP